MHRSKRRTTKFWLGFSMILSTIALFYALYLHLETAAAAITVMMSAQFTAYVGVGHMDYRQVLSNTTTPEPYQ